MTILELLLQDGLATKRVSSTNGGEYSSPCPGCGGKDRFRTWPEQGEGGRWWCRRCEKNGDIIQYLRDFRGLGFNEARKQLGLAPVSRKIRRLQARKETQAQTRLCVWKPRIIEEPPKKWQIRATNFIKYCEKELWSEKGVKALKYLQQRGLSDNSILSARLGWNPAKETRHRAKWGLEIIKSKKAGEFPKRRFILPAGIVIPNIVGETVFRVRIRKEDIIESENRYHTVVASTSKNMVLGQGPIFTIVESDLDALLLWQEAGDITSVIALGSAQNRPDSDAASLLSKSELIILSLDSDSAGAEASWNWWKNHFPQAIRWPIPRRYGKDPGEAFQNEYNLREWIEAAIISTEENCFNATGCDSENSESISLYEERQDVDAHSEKQNHSNQNLIEEKRKQNNGKLTEEITLPSSCSIIPKKDINSEQDKLEILEERAAITNLPNWLTVF